jgi:hypothetical protein
MMRWLLAVTRSLGRDHCGCATGALFLGLALLATSAWQAWHWDQASLAPWSAVGRVLGYSMLAALVGKALGIALHAWHRRSEVPRTH